MAETGAVARGERLVRENRFAIAVVVPLVGALLLVGSAESLLPPQSVHPLFLLAGTLIMRLPLLVTVGPLVDRRAGVLLVALSGFVYAIEFVGATTGWPYGGFRYLRDLGPMLFGTVPLGLPLFFLPLVLDAYLLSLLALGPTARRWSLRVGATLGVVLLIDLVLDPGAVTVGFWAYDAPGSYYGVPPSNYLGWLLTGSVAVIGVDYAFDRAALRERLDSCAFALDDLASFVVFWGVVNVYGRNWVPVALTGTLLLALLWVTRVAPGIRPGRPADAG